MESLVAFWKAASAVHSYDIKLIWMETSVNARSLSLSFSILLHRQLSPLDWFLMDSMKDWDEVSNKFLNESGCDLVRETRTIMAIRLQEIMTIGFKKETRFFGVYTGG